MKRLTLPILALSLTFAQEGMWTFDQLPKKQLKKEYNYELTDEFAQNMQLAALRTNTGGTGSFISPNGLVLTNHHVARSMIFSVSTSENDYIKEGFYANTLDDELKCPNVHIDQLIKRVDITERVNAHLTEEMSLQEKERRRQELLILFKEKAQEESGLHVQVVTLYHGLKYELYFYKRYTDVRLVLAPESETAAFGGDPENFEYPRQCFDYTLLRLYEDGKPALTPNYFKWSESGPKLNEVLFIVGNPGGTDRLITVAHLQDKRDVTLPLLLKFLNSRINLMEEFGKRGSEEKRRANKLLKRLMNGQKVMTGMHKYLEDKPVIQEKICQESDLFGVVNSKPWFDLEECFEKHRVARGCSFYVERGAFYGSQLFSFAKKLVQFSAERNKPSHKRLKEYINTELPTIERELFSQEPFFEDLETCLIDRGIKDLTALFGEDHPIIKQLLSGPSAEDIVSNSKLNSLELRKELYHNPELIKTSLDPAIVFARLLDPLAREIRRFVEDEFNAPVVESYSKICKTLIERKGEKIYPDATFTLRFAYGQMKGYYGQDRYLQPISTLGDLFATHDKHPNDESYSLPSRWIEARDHLGMELPVNFVSNHDKIGGNSGSAMINTNGEIVGLLFDGNRYAFGYDYKFDDTQGRAINVHSDAIIYSLDKMYGADRILKELGRK